MQHQIIHTEPLFTGTESNGIFAGFQEKHPQFHFPAVRLNTALVLEYLGRYGEAESVLLKLAEDMPKDYMPRMRLALLYARVEGEKPAAQRNYQQVMAYHEQAEKLYTGTGAPDSEMLQLRELVYQLKK
jgi:tetratricopeptide (TPR) repeat protein